MKTVKELYDELGLLIEQGHADTRVIANCAFCITGGNGCYSDFYLTELDDVYYQSGDIELSFMQKFLKEEQSAERLAQTGDEDKACH